MGGYGPIYWIFRTTPIISMHCYAWEENNAANGIQYMRHIHACFGYHLPSPHRDRHRCSGKRRRLSHFSLSVWLQLWCCRPCVYGIWRNPSAKSPCIHSRPLHRNRLHFRMVNCFHDSLLYQPRRTQLGRQVRYVFAAVSVPYQGCRQKKLTVNTGFIWFGSSVVTILFIILFVPEVRGRTLEEIEEMFDKGIPAWEFQSYVCENAAQARRETDQDSMYEAFKDPRAAYIESVEP